MLRLAVLLLVLLNAAYYVWSQGQLRAYGWAPAEQREPQRMEQQLRPEAIRILPPDEGRKAEQVALTPPKPPECLLAGSFDDDQTEAVRKKVESLLPAGSWVIDTTVEPAQWIIYMGRFSSAASMARKKSEVDRLRLKLYPLDNPGLQPGLVLGRFETQAQAQAELVAMHKQGVRTARVVQERPEQRSSQLRLPAVDEAQRAKLDDIKSVLGDRTLRACK